ncbi:hypothetical protein SISSUDRAFT_884868 [Sistotremastrum suecicum HHB10207 ss-3]|uniref:DUF985 domain-containing protein n=1 Tax=Sistotremastrum suecicum HHB10207 ss-3 TaxID=1314776 RepID=A0A166C6P5_9AGAM|nr:hypothetical protein SISSUDRAFT_884868 [Sistotremastrum suecicum HHB10207 ss-3]
MADYPYPRTNTQLISELNLQRHPEGGYYAETDRAKENVASPYADGAERAVSTTIYYLLTEETPSGVIHKNKSRTMHVLQEGRVRYTLISPGKEDGSAKVEYVTLGTNAAKGEVRQLMVEGDVWKMSAIPQEDLGKGDPEHVGCLITEVVTPGFHWEDHVFLTPDGLKHLFENDPAAADKVKQFSPFVKS